VKFQALWENMTVRSDPLGGEDFVSNLQKDPETAGGEKSGISMASGETYVDYWGKYTTKLKLFFPHATDEQIEALLFYKKHGMRKEFKKLYNTLYLSNPEVKKRISDQRKQRWANDPEYRKRKQELFKQRWANNPEFRKRRLEFFKQRLANDPEFRKRKQESEKQRFKQRYANDPEFRKRISDQQKQRWANDPEYRKRKQELQRQRQLKKKLGTFSQFVQDNN